MSPAPVEYKPLLATGMHRMTVAEFEALCVGGFPASNTRRQIFSGMLALLGQLSNAGLSGEVWVDGSFVTEKPEPKDCDLVVCANGVQLDSGPAALKDLVRRSFDTEKGIIKATLHCDAYLFPDYPVVHKLGGVTLTYREYWTRQFGFDRSKRPKGIIQLSLPVVP